VNKHDPPPLQLFSSSFARFDETADRTLSTRLIPLISSWSSEYAERDSRIKEHRSFLAELLELSTWMLELEDIFRLMMVTISCMVWVYGDDMVRSAEQV
jgi:hypothetical protein